MLTVEEAIHIILSTTRDFGIEETDLRQAQGKVLREDIVADRDMPPFDRVAMDGIAIQFEAFDQKVRSFLIHGMAAAGSPQQVLADPQYCLEIMTGGILPINADTIIPYEWITMENGHAIIQKENVIKGQNVHLRGTDRKKGDLLIASGRTISPSETGVLASVGKNKIKVSRLPKILIASTGNELAAIDQEPLPHQVRMSNVHQLHAAIQELKIEADTIHLQDDYDTIVAELTRSIIDYDAIIISGGISAGKFDHVPAVLEKLGVKKHFYKVKQKPGKPFWFGTHPGGCTVFGIPGNPVSSFLCYIRYIKLWIEKCLHMDLRKPAFAKLSDDVSFAADLTYFLNVQLHQNENAEWIAVPVKGHGSGDLSNLADTNAFIELPAEKQVFRRGEVYTVYRY